MDILFTLIAIVICILVYILNKVTMMNNDLLFIRRNAILKPELDSQEKLKEVELKNHELNLKLLEKEAELERLNNLITEKESEKPQTVHHHYNLEKIDNKLAFINMLQSSFTKKTCLSNYEKHVITSFFPFMNTGERLSSIKESLVSGLLINELDVELLIEKAATMGDYFWKMKTHPKSIYYFDYDNNSDDDYTSSYEYDESYAADTSENHEDYDNNEVDTDIDYGYAEDLSWDDRH